MLRYRIIRFGGRHFAIQLVDRLNELLDFNFKGGDHWVVCGSMLRQILNSLRFGDKGEIQLTVFIAKPLYVISRQPAHFHRCPRYRFQCDIVDDLNGIGTKMFRDRELY